MNLPLIQTSRLILRPWQPADLPPFAAMNADPGVMRYFPSTLSPEQSAAFLNRIETHFNNHGFGVFALEEISSGDFIGYCGFMIPAFRAWFTPCVEIGWRLRPTSWGRGLATEAARACLAHGFGKLGFSRIYSFTATLNLPSERVMQRIGMRKEGEFDHPHLEKGHPLCRHVLYRIDPSAESVSD
jgi:RimJ/RimL family protein N-acetyltransferase